MIKEKDFRAVLKEWMSEMEFTAPDRCPDGTPRMGKHETEELFRAGKKLLAEPEVHVANNVMLQHANHDFQGLSMAQRERLEVLAEEASEVAAQCMKILRHGYRTRDNITQTNYDNQMMLMDELLQMWTIVERMIFHCDIRQLKWNSTSAIWKSKMRYMHHQPPFHDPRDPPKGSPPREFSNAAKCGWDDFFQGRQRDQCPFPTGRQDLYKQWLIGWDSAREQQ